MRVIEVTTLLRPSSALLTPAMLVAVLRPSRKVARMTPAKPQPLRQPVAA